MPSQGWICNWCGRVNTIIRKGARRPLCAESSCKKAKGTRPPAQEEVKLVWGER